MALQPGVTILNGKYRILSLIGEGGMARVWLADELTFGGRQVAIKEPRAGVSADDVADLQRHFQQEISLTAALMKAQAPHIVPAWTVEPLDGALLLVMDFMPGGSLEDLLAKPEHANGLPVEQAIRIALEVLAALDALHGLPIQPVHRDVKPSNILFDAQGRAHLADFGLAQLPGVSGRSRLAAGPHPATPNYAAPEQLRSPEPLLPAADLFALGCVLWEMLTGQRYKRQRSGTKPSSLRGDTPAWLDTVVMRALAQDPWERWSSAREMAEVLRSVQAATQRAQQAAEAQRLADEQVRQAAKAQAAAQEQARQQAAEHAQAEGAARAHREEEARQRQQQLATWYAKAEQVAGQEPTRALALVGQIRAADPAYPGLGKIERRAHKAQQGARETGGRRAPRLGQLAAGVALAALTVVMIWALTGNFGLREDGTPTPTASPVLGMAQATATPVQPTETLTALVATRNASVGTSAELARANGLSCLADAYDGRIRGTVVTMAGPYTGEEEVTFNNSIKSFEDATGIDIQYEGPGNLVDFELFITLHIDAGDAQDIVAFPNLGLLNTFVGQDKIVPVTDIVPEAWLAENYLKSWRDMATFQGPDGWKEYGVWHRFNTRSLVWYPKKAFEAEGYQIPTTWTDLQALQEQIVGDGDTPWCVGIESGAATGWPATDWTEEFMLRTTALENYDKWITGDLPFSSPEVKNAIETFAGIWNDDAMVQGGTAAIVTTFFGDSPTPMFEDPPKCWLHKQSDFITSFFPPEAKYGEDYGVFYLPGVDEAYGKPFLVTGDIMAATENRPETCAVMQYFSTGESVKGWLAAGGALGPQKDVQLDWYGSDLERDIAGLVAGATSVRFDASDLMPSEVRSSFWKGMTEYFSRAADLDTVLAEIDASRPK